MEDRMKTVLTLAAASLAMGGTAWAQDAAPPQQEAPAQAAPKSADVSDDQVDRFALAVLKVQQIARDTAVDEQQKQAKMMAVMQESGLGPAEFQAIAAGSQSDPELKQRIRTAAEAHVKAAQDGAEAPGRP